MKDSFFSSLGTTCALLLHVRRASFVSSMHRRTARHKRCALRSASLIAAKSVGTARAPFFVEDVIKHERLDAAIESEAGAILGLDAAAAVRKCSSWRSCSA